MKRHMCILTMLFTTACATAKPLSKPLVIVEQEAIQPVPKSVKGLVKPVPEPQTPEHQECYDDLGLSPKLFLFDEKKTLAAAELRVYATETHDTARSNARMCSIGVGVLQQELNRSEEENRAYRRRDASWWFQNKTTVVGTTMFALGALTTILIVYGLEPDRNH